MKLNKKGFSLIEMMVITGFVGVFVLLMLNSAKNAENQLLTQRTSITRDRIIASMRVVSGMPAALRNSVRAKNADGSVVNPELVNCASGTVLNQCVSNVTFPLTLFSPYLRMNNAGQAVGVDAVTAPIGSATPKRFDSFAAPCTVPGPNCAIVVYTGFKARCPPPGLPSPRPDPIPPELLLPANTCTVAELIEVTYVIQLDPAVVDGGQIKGLLLAPVQGYVSTLVEDITGNEPQ